MSWRADTVVKKETYRLRIGLFLGVLLVAIFILADLQVLPSHMHQFYLSNRLQLQAPIITFAFFFSFTHFFYLHRYWLFSGYLILLTYTNYLLIYQSWVNYGFAFPYEGTIIYAFYCVFALGIPFRLALITSILSFLGFVVLMVVAPAYGDRVMISLAFVFGSLFTCVYAQYRLGKAVDLLEHSNAKLSSLSRQDGLTALLNRRTIMSESEQLISLAKRENMTMAAFMLDLDDFKKYNDEFGHQKGDEAIVVQADIMRAVFQRKTDILGRYGGEEFIVMVSGLSHNQVESRCHELLNLWEKAAMQHAPNAKRPVMSCSIGVAVASDVTSLNVEQLIAEADKSLYQAKAAGKATFVLSTLN